MYMIASGATAVSSVRASASTLLLLLGHHGGGDARLDARVLGLELQVDHAAEVRALFDPRDELVEAFVTAVRLDLEIEALQLARLLRAHFGFERAQLDARVANTAQKVLAPEVDVALGRKDLEDLGARRAQLVDLFDQRFARLRLGEVLAQGSEVVVVGAVDEAEAD